MPTPWFTEPNAVANRRAAQRLLTTNEEFELVSKLSQFRQKIDPLIAPLLQSAPPQTRLDHFDQRVAYLHTLRREVGSNPRAKPVGRTVWRQIDAKLAAYNDLRQELVLANLQWVSKLARSQRHSSVAEEDLFQEGVCGLLRAIDRFEAERGLRLMTYATWYIREAMQQIRARQAHLVSLSAHDQTLLGQMEQQRAEFQHENHRLPSLKELEHRLPGRLRTMRQLQPVLNPCVSLDRTANEGPVPLVMRDPVEAFDDQDALQVRVAQLLETLPKRERWVLTRRFGLDGQEPASLEVLGDDLNVSKERIRQLQRQAIKRVLDRENANHSPTDS